MFKLIKELMNLRKSIEEKRKELNRLEKDINNRENIINNIKQNAQNEANIKSEEIINQGRQKLANIEEEISKKGKYINEVQEIKSEYEKISKKVSSQEKKLTKAKSIYNRIQYILEKLKESNRFDYDGASYTFTKFGNISEGRTRRNVNILIEKDNINVKIDGEVVHLDLIYKMDIKELEDHFRITTRISEKGNTVSCLLYINLNEGESFIRAIESVRDYQIELSKEK